MPICNTAGLRNGAVPHITAPPVHMTANSHGTPRPPLRFLSEFTYQPHRPAHTRGGIAMESRASVAKHPIHVLLVGIPIGMWVFSLVADLIHAADGGWLWSDIAFFTMAGG